MSFINVPDDTPGEPSGGGAYVGPEGDPNSNICFIGDAPDSRSDLAVGRPFMGEAGRLWEHCLHKAGILRGEVYITNFAKYPMAKVAMDKVFTTQAGLKGRGFQLRDKLLAELENVDANIFVPMGGAATCALLGLRGVTKYRGYPYQTTLPSGKVIKVIPTLHPSSALYGGSFINIWYIAHDFTKAAKMSIDKEFKVDESYCEIPQTIEDCLRIIEGYRDKSPIAFDIEVINYEVSCISFSTHPARACSMPIHWTWTVEEELQIWLAIAALLEDCDTTKVGQNLIFDMLFLLSHNGIYVQGDIIDTMIGHHIVYPDMLKGLGFLASIYTDRPYWKDMVNFKNIKVES